MWRCPKCSKVFDGNSRICRECGAILEETPDEALPKEEGNRPAEPIEDAKPPVVIPDVPAQYAQLNTASPWRCGSCYEEVPGNFDVCWSCGADQEGSQVVSATEFRGSATTDQTRFGDSVLPSPDLVPCPECQAVAVMRGLPLVNEDAPDMELKVVSCGRPQALVFKDLYFGTVRADVCGRCGYVRFRVTNPEELLGHYQESRDAT